MRIASSILPWRSCQHRAPWVGESTADRTIHALKAIVPTGPTIWGGDWNHALSGPETSGSLADRRAITAAADHLGLVVPTAELPHRIDGLLSIDHVAVPADWRALGVERVVAEDAGVRLSDHDAYVVEVA